ncbi:rhodanese-like domain-containing protein [Pyxidicoccus xibeiensis]|uniref:rhodanese-like domain-containing protein n=1 Tax=Pyxidicoccus xibeiensis TaxID=2906759 RepID=UPI0020A7ACF4|nr:rhodanese-like domain-containing protein [Pyxidicoccus xibeiensis]MCP3136857.1 rhodanese-like domain-containing protein [Pyxidicoccus xibeiensis]
MSSLFDVSTPHASGYREVDVRQLAALPLAPLSLVDVREPAEFDGLLGHLEGAQLVPLAVVRNVATGWPRDADVLLVCRSGARSAKAAVQLAELGFTRVMNLCGGMLAWNTAGLPVVRPPLLAVPTLGQVLDNLLASLHRAVAAEPASSAPSREALTALLDALQAAPPPAVRDLSGFERLLRDCRDLLSIARTEAR